MPTLDELDAVCAWVEDQQLYHDSLYHSQKVKIVPKAIRPSPVIWIVKDGKPVDFNKKGE